MSEKKFLIAVDLQNDFITGSLGTAEAETIVGAAAARIAECRAAGWKVIATLDTHGADYMDTSEGRKLPVPHCVRGTEGWKIEPAIDAALGDSLRLEKPTFGSVKLPEVIARETGAGDRIERAAAQSAFPGGRHPGEQRLLRRRDARKAQGRAGDHGKLPDRSAVKEF